MKDKPPAPVIEYAAVAGSAIIEAQRDEYLHTTPGKKRRSLAESDRSFKTTHARTRRNSTKVNTYDTTKPTSWNNQLFEQGPGGGPSPQPDTSFGDALDTRNESNMDSALSNGSNDDLLGGQRMWISVTAKR